jgi:carbon monoxide dehydrogenase subunit G
MDMNGSRQLAATQQQAWDALNDPEVLKACIPGCDKIEVTAENQYSMAVSLKIGPVSAKFAGKIALSDIVPPQSYKLAFEGQGGAAGFGKGSSVVTLVPNDAGCELQYTVNASVGGKIAQVGQRLIDGVAKSMAEDFFKRFDQQMQARHPAPVSAENQAADGAGSPQAAPDSGAPKGGEGIPKWVWWGVAAVIAAAYFALRK